MKAMCDDPTCWCHNDLVIEYNHNHPLNIIPYDELGAYAQADVELTTSLFKHVPPSDPLQDLRAAARILRYRDYYYDAINNRIRINNTLPEEFEVTSNELALVDRRVAQELEKRKADELVQIKLQMIDDYGIDGYASGTTFRVEKQFVEDGKKYTYAFLKLFGKWYGSGLQCPIQGKSWTELAQWLVAGDFPVARADMVRLFSMEEAQNLIDNVGAMQKSIDEGSAEVADEESVSGAVNTANQIVFNQSPMYAGQDKGMWAAANEAIRNRPMA